MSKFDLYKSVIISGIDLINCQNPLKISIANKNTYLISKTTPIKK